MGNASGSHATPNATQYERSNADLYCTPASAVHALHEAVDLTEGGILWDSSAGLGHIVAALRDCGITCIGTELHDHPHDKVAGISTGVDLFLLSRPLSNNAIINPPYAQAAQHIRHMLDIGCESVWALLRLNFIAAKKHADLMDRCSDILIVGRAKILPPDAVDKGFSPTIDFAWMRFGQQPSRLKTLRRI